jgi:hypothetical protein
MVSFRKLVKKFKKINIYIRVGIVYCVFLFIKWAMYESTGIEIGKEGMSVESKVVKIQSDVQKLANMCSKKEIGKITKEQKKLKELLKKQMNQNIKKIKCPKCPTCPKAKPCKNYRAELIEVN